MSVCGGLAVCVTIKRVTTFKEMRTDIICQEAISNNKSNNGLIGAWRTCEGPNLSITTKL